MVNPNPQPETELRALAAAVKSVPVETRPAWRRVWARVQPAGARPQPSRWPSMVAVSMAVSTLVLALHFNLVGPLHPPTVAAQTVPGPQQPSGLTATQISAVPVLPMDVATQAPRPSLVGTPAPVPVPPGGHS